MIAGLLRATTGRIELAGYDLEREPEKAKAALGFIPDRPFLYEKLSAAEFLRFIAGIYGIDGQEVTRRIDELLRARRADPRKIGSRGELLPWDEAASGDGRLLNP